MAKQFTDFTPAEMVVLNKTLAIGGKRARKQMTEETK